MSKHINSQGLRVNEMQNNHFKVRILGPLIDINKVGIELGEMLNVEYRNGFLYYDSFRFDNSAQIVIFRKQ